MKRISKEDTEKVAKAFNKEVWIDENGRITFNGGRAVVVSTNYYPYGEGTVSSLRPILYRNGMNAGKNIVSKMKKLNNNNLIMDFVLAFLVFIGFGTFEVVSETESEVLIRLHDSFEADSYKKNSDKPATQPVCHFTRGILDEVFSELKGKAVAVEETTCAAMDGSYCEFKITVSEK